MRIKSSIFVSALIRQEIGQGAFAAVLKKGAEDAGAIYIVHLKGFNDADFYGPAPQMFLEENNPGDRLFEKLGSELSEAEIKSKMESQLKFDPDCWIVEIEKSNVFESIQIVDPL